MHGPLSGASRCPRRSLYGPGRLRPSCICSALCRTLLGCLSAACCRRGARRLVRVLGRRMQCWQSLRALLCLRRLRLRARPPLRMAWHVHRARQPRFLRRVPRSIRIQPPFVAPRTSPHRIPVGPRASHLRGVHCTRTLPRCDCASRPAILRDRRACAAPPRPCKEQPALRHGARVTCSECALHIPSS